jgi:hypothetical protein
MRIRNFALLAVWLAVFGVGCGDSRDYSLVVAGAMEGGQAGYTNSITTIANRGNTIFQVSLTNFVGEMRKVDVSGCPCDFREAWDGYIKVVEDHEVKEPVLRYTALGQRNAVRVKWDVPLDNNGMEFRNAWEQLDDAAGKYKPSQQ